MLRDIKADMQMQRPIGATATQEAVKGILEEMVIPPGRGTTLEDVSGAVTAYVQKTIHMDNDTADMLRQITTNILGQYAKGEESDNAES